MAATASGAVCAAWIAEEERPSYASSLSLDRYNDHTMIAELREAASKRIRSLTDAIINAQNREIPRRCGGFARH